jgi:hypothetical protein
MLQLREVGECDWPMAGKVHMQGRGKSEAAARNDWREPDECVADRTRVGNGGVGVGVGVVVDVVIAERGGGGRMTAWDRRWKSETGASNFEAGGDRARRGGRSGSLTLSPCVGPINNYSKRQGK